MIGEISPNERLEEETQRHRWQQPASSSAVVRENYQRKERLDENKIWKPLEGNDRRARIFSAVDDALGMFKPNKRAGSPLLCDPYLCDATYRWINDRAKSEPTWKSYAIRMADWVAYTEKRALSDQIETVAREVQDYLCQLDSEGMSRRTVVWSRDIIRSWFGWLEDHGMIDRAPISRDIKRGWRIDQNHLVIHNGRRHALTLEESQAITRYLFDEAKPVAAVAVLLLMSAGLRSIEVTRLERKDLHEHDGTWSVTVTGKGHRCRVVVLEQVVVVAWQRYADSRRLQGTRGPLLARPGGGPYSPRRVQQWAQDAARAIHRHDEISSHGLRRTAATLRIENGAQLDQAQKLLGHASMQQTAQCYVVRTKPCDVASGIVPPTGEP
jgi:site-specific recombinase XerD